MINKNDAICESHLLPHQLNRISWTAIFVGALVVLGLGFLLNLFGLAIGLSAFTLSKNGANVLAIGGLIGLLIGVIASTLVAGYTSGYLGRLYCPKRNLGILYGFTTWSLALVLSAAIAVPLSNYVSAYITTVSHSASASVATGMNKTGVVTVESTPSEDKNQRNIKISAPSSSVAGAAFIVFALFFIGAFFTCIGACWGMSCRRED